MGKTKSKYVCKRCGVAVGGWCNGWKHFATVNTPSCGKPPIIVEREIYEREMAQFIENAFGAIEIMREGHAAK